MKSFGLKELAEHYFATESEAADYVSASDYEKLLAERDALVSQLTDAFGDGYYDGFLDGAKHHEKTDCNTEPAYLGDHALMCSEIAESEKASRIGGSKKQHALADIKSEAGRAGFVAGLEYPDLVYFQDATGDLNVAADQYAAKIRNTGTWLKDSNVNGGKRGGEK